MKNFSKKAFSVIFVPMILAVLMLLGAFSAFAATSGYCGTGAVWNYDEQIACLTISGEGEMTSYSYNGGNVITPWKDFKNSIRHVKISSGIVSVGSNAFYGCSELEDVELPDTLTKIGSCSFGKCTALKGVAVPDSVTEMASDAVYGCDALEELIIPENVRISAISLNNIISSQAAKNLYKLFLPECINKIPDSFFENNTHLKEISMPGVYEVGKYAFSGCKSLKKVILSPNSMSVTIGEYAFYDCESLGTLGIRTCGTIGKYAFGGCTNLKTIYNTCSYNFDGSYNFSADSTSFMGVKADVYYQSEYSHSGNFGGGTFNWIKATSGICGYDAYWNYDSEKSLLTISGSGSILRHFSGSDMPWYNYRNNISKIVIENGITEIPSYTFEYMSSVESVSLPDTLLKLYPNAFNDCQILNNLVIPSNVKLVYSAQTCYWYRCPNLTDVYYVGTEQDWNGIYTPESTEYKITPHFLTLHKATQTCEKAGLPAYYAFEGTSNKTLYDTQKRVWQMTEPYALGHSFTNYISNKDETCLADGTKTAKCDRCGVTSTITNTGSKKNHSYTGTLKANYNGTHSFKCVNGCNEYGGAVSCSGGKATCTHKAVCGICGEEYGAPLGHSFINYRPNGDETCLADGTKTAKCDRCDVTSTVVNTGSKKNHSYTGALKANYNGTHSFKCVNGCGEYGGTVSCSGGKATCTQKAVCGICGEEYGAPLGHSFINYRPNGDETCLADGTKTSKCERCDATKTITDPGTKKNHSYTGEFRANNNGTHSFKCVNGCGEYGGAVSCFGGKATCTQKAVCGICAAEYGNLLEHSYTGTVKANNDGTHSFKCVNGCGEYGGAVSCFGGKATCTQKAVCTACGGEYGSPLGHNFAGTAKANNDGTHSFKCVNGCGEYGGTVSCSGGKATCMQRAVCAECKSEYGEMLPHSYAGTVKANNDGTHSFKCVNGCNEYGSGVSCFGGTATCTQRAVCAECKGEYGEMLPHSYAGTVKANNDGTHSFKCVNGCNEYGGTVNCSGGKATCTQKSVCVECKGEYGEMLPHSYTGKVKSNSDGTHSFMCENGCGKHGGSVKCAGGTAICTKKATMSENGALTTKCKTCGTLLKTQTVYAVKSVTLSGKKFTYTGKAIKPSVTVTDGSKKVISSSNYTVSYSDNVKVGTGKVTVKFKGNYSGSKTLTFTIAPKQVTGLKASDVKTTSLKLTWTKATGAKYYKVEQSTDGKTWKTVKTVSTNNLTISKLTAGKKYQFRVTALDSTKKITGAKSEVLKTGTQTKAPAVTLKSAKSKTATATWKKVTGASKYIVYKSTDGKKWAKVTTTTKLTYNLTKLSGGKKIYVKVYAVNACGKNSVASAVKSVTVKK